MALGLDHSMNKEAMNRVGAMIGGGCLMSVIGVTAFFFGGGISLLRALAGQSDGAEGVIIGVICMLMAVGGLVLVIVGLFVGIREGSGDNRDKPEQRVPQTYIIGKLVLDLKGEQVYDPDMYEPEELQLLVQVRMPGKRKEEFKTHPLVFNSIGEGMTGTVVFQGRWLSQFIPEIKPGGPSQDSLPPDPFSSGRL
jgi:hypothetical protein